MTARRRGVPLPTDAELEILRILWIEGPCTVREVQHVMARRRATGYTTVLKLLQIMHGKGLVARDESSRSHVYEAAVARDETERRLVSDLAERAFGGSAALLAMQALSSERASDAELKQIRRMLDRLDEGGA